jgi:hypothetical protein
LKELAMSKGMLGNLRLSEVMGTLNDLTCKLAGEQGHLWLIGLKGFLRNSSKRIIPELQDSSLLTFVVPSMQILIGWDDVEKHLEKAGVTLVSGAGCYLETILKNSFKKLAKVVRGWSVSRNLFEVRTVRLHGLHWPSRLGGVQ